MSQLRTTSPDGHAGSPLMLSDRLLRLADDAGRAGLQLTADRLVMLAHSVLDEAPAPSLRDVRRTPLGAAKDTGTLPAAHVMIPATAQATPVFA